MSELKCKECGAMLAQGTKECSSCGCPIEEVKFAPAAPIETKSAKKFNVMSIISLILGVVIIVMGVSVMNKEVSIDTYSAGNYNADYDADYAAFGGDFYTEIYGATDIIVDELNDVVDELDDLNGGVEVLSESIGTMANVIYYPVGMLIIAIGLGVVAMSCNHMIKVGKE